MSYSNNEFTSHIHLPQRMWIRILQQLEFQEITHVGKTCRHLQTLSRYSEIWKDVLVNLYPFSSPGSSKLLMKLQKYIQETKQLKVLKPLLFGVVTFSTITTFYDSFHLKLFSNVRQLSICQLGPIESRVLVDWLPSLSMLENLSCKRLQFDKDTFSLLWTHGLSRRLQKVKISELRVPFMFEPTQQMLYDIFQFVKDLSIQMKYLKDPRTDGFIFVHSIPHFSFNLQSLEIESCPKSIENDMFERFLFDFSHMDRRYPCLTRLNLEFSSHISNIAFQTLKDIGTSKYPIPITLSSLRIAYYDAGNSNSINIPHFMEFYNVGGNNEPYKPYMDPCHEHQKDCIIQLLVNLSQLGQSIVVSLVFEKSMLYKLLNDENASEFVHRFKVSHLPFTYDIEFGR
ncbi:MAG: hypothetical protein Sylvanvirus11_23 [Sylvanvirus sp.]|uniref:F-box domain-containing protein n=1 Tax=Sylvanvirus sp. TaxID=2487774 RepID=A0A3G5AI57_9VIRU|nr:MAG: hypothetical protein Sylvanvirus11_23 [Sylvanvirus sp.]